MKKGDTQLAADLSFTNVGINLPTKILFDVAATPITNAEGLLQWNATDGTLDLGMSGGDIAQQIGQELFTKVRNPPAGSTILNGSAVYISGRSGVFPDIALARSDSDATSRVLGITTQDIASPAFGFVTTAGYVRGIKTDYSGVGGDAIHGTAWVTGDLLYVSKTDAGILTNVEPASPHHSDVIGTVGVVAAAQGSILITLDRHKTLAELTDVNGTALTVTGQIPVWNQTAGYFDFTANITNYPTFSGGVTNQVAVWSSSSALTAGNIVQPASLLTLVSGAYTFTIPGTGQPLIAAVAATVVGYVPFYSSTTGTVSSDAGFFWDNTNKFLGLNTATPGSMLDIKNGAIEFSGTIGFTSGKVRVYKNSSQLTFQGDALRLIGTAGAAVWYADTTGFIVGNLTIPAAKLHIINNSDKHVILAIAHSTQSATSRMLSIQNSSLIEQVYVSGDYVLGTKGRRPATRTVTAATTMTVNDEVIEFNSATAITQTLIAATGTQAKYTFLNRGLGRVTLDGASTDTIHGDLTQYIDQYESFTVHDVASGIWMVS